MVDTTLSPADCARAMAALAAVDSHDAAQRWLEDLVDHGHISSEAASEAAAEFAKTTVE